MAEETEGGLMKGDPDYFLKLYNERTVSGAQRGRSLSKAARSLLSVALCPQKP